MTEQIYMKDAYLKACSAEVIQVSEMGNQKVIILDRTVMQPSHRDGRDRGHFICEDGAILHISSVVIDKHANRIEHRGKGKFNISVGAKIECEIDWDTRYKLMRKHTANHLSHGCNCGGALSNSAVCMCASLIM